jgi:hypothetical protein
MKEAQICLAYYAGVLKRIFAEVSLDAIDPRAGQCLTSHFLLD